MNRKNGFASAMPRWVNFALLGLSQTLVLLFVLAVAGLGSAGANDIVDVRMGAHDGYVRLVFQTEEPSAYRFERASGGEDVFVSIQARSGPLAMQSPAPPVDSVTVAPGGSGTLARVELVRSGVEMKEMVLTAPPRIVLDFIVPDSTEAPVEVAPAPRVETAQPAPAVAEPKPQPPAPAPAKEPAVDIWALDPKR